MSEFLGSRISLISKSDIRYVGTLHEINSDDSTVSLENVRSFGTEGRRGGRTGPDGEVAPADQIYEYIVFRGSDVKDLRIEEHPSIKENKPPAMPDDPAIVGARAQQAHQPAPPHGPPGPFPPGPYPPNNFYGGPPPPGSWGRGGPGPMPGPAFGNMPYPPPPGWFPPGHGMPLGAPPGPGPWSNQPFLPGPPELPSNDAAPKQPPAPVPSQDSHLQAGGPGAGRSKPTTPSSQNAPPTEPKTLAQVARQASNAPNLPVESKPSAEEVSAVAAGLRTNGTAAQTEGPKAAPTGPKPRVMPVIPLSGVTARPTQAVNIEQMPGQTSVKANVSSGQMSVQDATNAARAAVAVAMSQLGNSGGNAMDNLTKKVNEMRVQAVRGGPVNRGRGRGPSGRPATKVEVPDSDFDFAQSNAKFDKEALLKEAIAGAIPDEAEAASVESAEPAAPEDVPAAYNKSRSFFDNISSEAKERGVDGSKKAGGREWRGEEQRKNMETFGQGSVDGGGYRNYRGRGRGRGGFRGRGGYGRGGRGGSRPPFQPTSDAQ